MVGVLFRDLVFFVCGMLLLGYAHLLIFFGLEHYDKWLMPLLYGLYYGIICFTIFVLTIRLIKSRLVFCLTSWCVVFFLLSLNIQSAKKIGLTEKKWGYDIFVNGEITNIGIAYKIADPLGGMACVATILFIVQLVKTYLKVESN